VAGLLADRRAAKLDLLTAINTTRRAQHHPGPLAAVDA
jgi:hypothetical protein